ncbi:MAG: tetratricopeptide repeat protein [Phycisphaeraceae bacterium]
MLHRPTLHASRWTPANGRRLNAAGTLTLLLTVIFTLAPQHNALAVRTELDESRFATGLRERGMQDLLRYYLENNPPEDALDEQAIRIELHKLDFDDESLPPDQRMEAVDEVIAAYRTLVDAAGEDHPQRPIWRTELAEFILRVALPVRHLNAGEFVEFGVPTRQARDAFDRLVPIAHEQMEIAFLEAFDLQGSLPRRDDFQSAFVNTGYWTMLNRDFMSRRIPFARGWASYYATLTTEPTSSTDAALQQLREVSRDNLNDAAQSELDSLIGRVLVKAGEYGEAQELLAPIKQATADDITGQGLWVRLAWVHALKGAGREAAAVEQVEEILGSFRNSDATIPPPLVILTHDAWYRVTDDLDVFEQLFEEPLIADVKDQVRSFVAARLATEPKTPAELVDEPALIALAHADAMIDRGLTLREDQPAAADEEFEAAQAVLEEVIARPSLDDRTQSRARFRLGSMAYQRERPVAAIQQWVELGRLLPDQPEAVNATINAFTLAHTLYRQYPDRDNVIELFDAASETLLHHQPDHRVARQHTYTRAAFLRRQKRYDEAIAAYNQVAIEHTFYPDALYETAVIFHTYWLGAEPDDRGRRGRQALEAVDLAIDVFERNQDRPGRRESLRQKHGDAVLIKAELLLQQIDDAEGAEQLLADFVDRFGQIDDLLRHYERLQVSIAVGLGRFDDARQRVQAFAERGTEEGGSLITGALQSVTDRADDLRQQGDAEAADQLNQLAVQLAEDLVAWADRQPEYRDDPLRRLNLRIILAQQQRAAGQLEASRELLESLYEMELGTNEAGETATGSNQLEVLYELAQTALAQGDHERARPLVNRILRLHPTKEGRTWWHSWVMTLEIRDATYDELIADDEQQQAQQVRTEIFRAIQRLRLNDSELGGQPWQRQLESLSLRHRPP